MCRSGNLRPRFRHWLVWFSRGSYRVFEFDAMGYAAREPPANRRTGPQQSPVAKPVRDRPFGKRHPLNGRRTAINFEDPSDRDLASSLSRKESRGSGPNPETYHWGPW